MVVACQHQRQDSELEKVGDSKTESFYWYCFAVVVGSAGTFMAGEVDQTVNRSKFLLSMKMILNEICFCCDGVIDSKVLFD